MTVTSSGKIEGPAAWTGTELRRDRSWVLELGANEISALDEALDNLRAAGKSFPDFGKEDFPLPQWSETLAALGDALENGPGFMLVRGLPVDRYTEQDLKSVYYGIGLNLGTPVRQNPKGDLLGAVMNVGDLSDRNTRVYETNAYLPYHTDPSDVVGLLCVRKAKAGGISSLVSVASVYNRILERHPELIECYYQPWYYAHLGEDLPTLSPLFSFHQGKLAFRYLRQYIELGHDVMRAPLTDVQRTALDVLDRTTTEDDLKLDMLMEPGDIQWANNYLIMHSRTAFEDFEDPGLRRMKLRLWLKMANARTLAPDFPGRNGFPETLPGN